MIIIRNSELGDISTIVIFNSAMEMETEKRQLDSDTVHKGVNELLNNNEHGFYLIAKCNGVPVGQLMITK